MQLNFTYRTFSSIILFFPFLVIVSSLIPLSNLDISDEWIEILCTEHEEQEHEESELEKDEKLIAERSGTFRRIASENQNRFIYSSYLYKSYLQIIFPPPEFDKI